MQVECVFFLVGVRGTGPGHSSLRIRCIPWYRTRCRYVVPEGGELYTVGGQELIEGAPKGLRMEGIYF